MHIIIVYIFVSEFQCFLNNEQNGGEIPPPFFWEREKQVLLFRVREYALRTTQYEIAEPSQTYPVYLAKISVLIYFVNDNATKNIKLRVKFHCTKEVRITIQKDRPFQ